MRREVLYSAVSRVRKDLINANIPEMFETLMESVRHSSEGNSKSSIEAFQKYTIATHNYSKNEKHICKILQINELQSTEYWTELLGNPGPDVIFKIGSNIRFAVSHLPKILDLIKQDYVAEIKNKDASFSKKFNDKEIITVLIVEENMHFSSPERLANVLESMTLFYDVFAVIDNESASDLSVIACDSGSDKSFDFLGLSTLIEKIKDLIITLWDRKVLYRHREMHETLNLISTSLPILDEIDTLKKNKKIEPEQAELLKRKTIEGVTKFLEAGATIPELNEESSHSPRSLMKPNQKLLVAPENVDSSKESKEPIASDLEDKSKLSEKEISQLEELLKKAKKNNSNKTATKEDNSRKKKT